MDIPDLQTYRSPTGSSDSEVTPETELTRAKKEQLTLGASDSGSDSDTSEKENDYEDPKEDDPVDSDTGSQERDEAALDRIIRRTSQLIKEGKDAMVLNSEAGPSNDTEQLPPVLMMEEELQQWRTHAANLKQQIEDKELEVRTLQAVATGKKRTPKTPNPDPFHGDADKIEAFLMQLALKITDNPDYEAEPEKKRLFFSLLKGRAFVWAKPYIHEQDNNVTIAQLAEKLRAAFGDPDPRARAEAKLMKLHQGSWTYTKYLTETLALHADLTLDDEAKIMYFR